VATCGDRASSAGWPRNSVWACAEPASVTERYLHFAYEVIALTLLEGPSGPEQVGISIFNGGTLVMDESWNDVLLVTDPPATTEDLGADNPALRVLERATERFQTLLRRALRSVQTGARRGGSSADRSILYEDPSCPFVVKAEGNGAARFTRRPCNIADHLRGFGAAPVGLRFPGGGLFFDLR
jgi:hypothetical protein